MNCIKDIRSWLTCTSRRRAAGSPSARTRRWVCCRRPPASGPACARTGARSWSWGCSNPSWRCCSWRDFGFFSLWPFFSHAVCGFLFFCSCRFTQCVGLEECMHREFLLWFFVLYFASPFLSSFWLLWSLQQVSLFFFPFSFSLFSLESQFCGESSLIKRKSLKDDKALG